MGAFPAPAAAFVAPILVVLAAPPARGLQITEIMYHPRGAPEEPLEWLEVFNDSATPCDLSGFHFSRGIQFAFGEGFTLEGKAYVVVAANAPAVREAYGIDNATGDFAGRLDNGGETIELASPEGAAAARVRYRTGGDWPTAPDGAGYSLSLRWPFADPADPANWAPSRRPGGTPGRENFPPPPVAHHEVFPASGPGSAWRYRKGWDPAREAMAAFSEPPGAWVLPGFDDSSWEAGEAPIGFGEAGVATVLDDMLGRYLAVAARKGFTLGEEEIGRLSSLEISLWIDDGCVVYLNGEELGRIAVSGAPGDPVPFDAGANATREASTVVSLPIARERVQSGENLLAIQLHNASVRSNDAYLAASLAYRVVLEKGPQVPAVWISEVRTSGPPGERFVEIASAAPVAVDLAGFFLSTRGGDLQAAGLPPGTILAPGAFAAFREPELGLPLAGPRLEVFLTAPDGETVVEAVTVEEPPGTPQDPWSHARRERGGRFLVSSPPTAGGPNRVVLPGEVVINEIHYHPLVGEEDLEFIELHNLSDRDVPLGGFRLRGGYDFQFAPEAAIAAGGFLVIARHPEAVEEAYGIEGVLGPPPGASAEEIGAFGRLGNSGEEIELLDPAGNPADRVRYRDGGDWDPLADGGGSSLELIDPRQDNAAGQAWAASLERGKAPWVELTVEGEYRTNLPPLPMESELWFFLLDRGECLIDQVSLVAGEPPREYVPGGGFEEDTSPWRLAGTHIHSRRTTAEAHAGAASLHLIATGAGDSRVNRVETDTAPSLGPGPVRIRFWARWLAGSNRLHVSGYNNALGRTVTLPVLPGGTPGRENSVRAQLAAETGSGNLGPVVSEVSHSPPVPRPALPVRIAARASDADGVAAVEARYRTDSPGGREPFARVPLHDDGEHEDGAAGDGLYAGEIPPGGSSDRIAFFIHATDAAGRSRTYPQAGEEGPLVFMVDDGFFSGLGLENSLLRYRLILDHQNLSTLLTRLLHSDDLVHGTFIFEEREVYYNVGVRYRGSPWTRDNTPRMFRLRFPNDHPFRGETRRINLNRSGDEQNEGAAYYLVRKASVPEAKAPYSPVYEYLNLKLNERPHSSRPMAEVRPVDSVYSEFWWPGDEGYNWKITAKQAFTDAGEMAGVAASDFRYYGPSKEDFRFYYTPGIRKNDDEFGPLMDLLRVLDRATTPDTEYEEPVGEILAVESSLRVFAVRAFLADWDTIGFGPGKNAYLQFAAAEGRHYLLPWDMDNAFSDPARALVPSPGAAGLGRLLSFPRYRRLYGRILKENLDGAWSAAVIDRWLERVDAVIGPARASSPTTLKGFLRQRRTVLREHLGAAAEVDFAISPPGPLGAPASALEIRGTAPLEVAFLLGALNGGELLPLRPVWEGPAGPGGFPVVWRLTVEGLRPGRNELTLLALDGRGGLRGTASAVLHDTTGWPPPSILEVAPASGPAWGGTAVTVRGSGFQEGLVLLFGDREAREVSLLSAGELLAATPPGAGQVAVAVRNIDGQRGVLEGAFTYEEVEGAFVRGDADTDGELTVSDAVAVLQYLYTGRALECLDAADTDDDGRLRMSDAVRLLMFLGGRGPAPLPPYPERGPDPTPDDPFSCAAGG